MAKTPSFWNPDTIGEHKKPDIMQARAEGLAAGLKPWTKDLVKRIVVGIDYQIDFIRDDGTLKVTGAAGDVRRFVEYIYGRAEEISGLLFTMDQHLPWQIFYPVWWKNRNGVHPGPYTVITEDEVKSGAWLPQLEKSWSLAYPTRLRETGQSPLIIWPEHCMIGTDGAALLAELAEAVAWLAAARGIQPIYMFKGTVPQSEHYGPFRCCVPVPGQLQSQLQTAFLDIIAQYDIIDVAGEAEDFCVREGMRQLLEYFGDRPDVLKKMRFLGDCTSLVFPDKRAEADNILADYTSKGVQIIKSTEA